MRLLSYFLLLGCLTLFSSELFAITFIGGFENNIWGDSRNWSPQQVPGGGDEAVIPIGKLVNVNGNITVGTLILGGTLANNADPGSKLTINTNFSWTDGTVACPVYLSQGCASLWQGSLGLGANLFNHGEITVSANVSVSYSVLKNESDGVINLSGGAKMEVYNNPAILDNYGVLNRTGAGGGTFTIILGHTNYVGSQTNIEEGELFSASLDNYAPITISGGATFRTNDMRIYNGTSITGGGTFVSNNNGIYMNNTDLVTIDVSETELNSQGVKQSGPVTFTQHLNWKAGTMFAQVTFAMGCVVDINPGGSKGITNTTTNNGTINVNDSFGFDTGRLDNNGTINLNGAYSNGIYHASEGIHNYGTIQKPVGAFGTYNMAVPLYNEPSGHLLVQEDELFVNSNLFNSGEIIVNADATLRTHTTESRNGGTFSGPGTFIIQNNGLNAVNTSPISLDFAEIVLNANIGNTGAVTITGHVNWTQGDLAAPVTFASGSVIDMNPGGNHGISGTTTNNGTFNLNTSFTLSAGHIDNNGIMLLNGAHTIGIYYGTPGIFNHGTVKKTTGNSGVFNMGVPLTNFADGQVIVEEGELHVSSQFSNSGSLNVAANAIFKANKTVVENTAVFTGAGTLIIQNNGLTANNNSNVTFDIAETVWLSSLNGAGPITFTQHVSWQNANLFAAVTIANGATLDLTTGGAHGIGGASTLTNNGTMNANVNFGGGTVNNNGILNLASGLNFGGGTLNNAGTMTNNSGGNVTTGYFVNNTGTIAVTSGIFTFSYGLSNAGTIDVAAGANARLENYHQDNSFGDGSVLSGAGSFTLEANCTVNGVVNVDIETFILNSIYYGFYGTGIMTFNHNFDWQAGSVDNTIVISTGNSLNLTGVGTKILNGTLTNHGTVNCDSDFYTGYDAVLNNNGSFNLTGDNIFGAGYGFAGQFNNAGVLNKTSAGTLVFGMFLNNLSAGSVSIQNGVMEVGKLDNAGSLVVSENATLTIKSGSNLSGGTVSGIGTLRIQDNGWHLSSTLIINSLDLEIAGNLTGDAGASLEIESVASWFGGDLAVPCNVTANGVLHIPDGGYLSLSAPLTNAGIVNCSVALSSNANISNTGTLNLGGNYSGFFGSDTDTLHNTGIINANSIYYNYLYLNVVNDGTIEVLSGVAYFNNGLEHNQTISIAQDAEMFLYGTCVFSIGSSVTGTGSITSDGTLILEENFSFSGEMFQIGDGTLIGPGDLTVHSAMTWQYGDIETDVDIESGATLIIGYDNGGGGGNNSRSLNLSNSGFTLYNTITNDGTTTQNTYYYMDGGAFVNNGTIDMDDAGIYDDNGGGGSFSNNGIWNVQNYFDTDINATNDGTLAGSAELDFNIELVNNGIVVPGNSIGQMSFSPNYTNGSELQIEIEHNDGPGYGHDFVTSDGNIQLNGNLVVTETGSPYNAQYVIMQCNAGPGCLTGTFASISMPSDYTIEYTGEQVILTKGTPATISPADTMVCYNSPVTLTASTGESYAWSTGETTQSIEVFAYYDNTYSVLVTDANGGISAATANVNLFGTPYVYVDPYYSVVCEGESVTLTAYSYNNETYEWSTGESTQSISVSPVGYSSYTVTATDANGCTAYSDAYVDISGQAVVPNITGVPSTICQTDVPIDLPTVQDGYYGEWTGSGVLYNVFDPAGLSGNQSLTFTPYTGQCAAPATWIINVEGGSTYYQDSDGDGFGNISIPETSCTQPSGYVLDHTDCDDTDAAIHPNATEICNDLDDNCDGQIDEGVQSTFYADADGDGYGNAAVSQMACSAPSGFVNDNTDCNDNNAQIHPGAQEVCNDIDDDCDGLVDEGALNTYYADADGDGYGNPAISQDACSAPNGYVLDNTDCDDTKPGVNPGAPEICNGLDDDCDGLEDEGVQSTFYADADWDGYGDANVTMQSCGPDEGFVANNTDCDDTNPNIHDGAAEICNGLDDDCDGLVDEDVLSTFYADNDGDGYGDLNITILACSAPPGYVNDPNDCNDSNDQIHPGAPETCNGLDDDCDGLVDEGDICDEDGDGYTIAEGDCDDTNPNIYPGALEICNSLDDDCDGFVDENVGTTWYADADSDGYGEASDSQIACNQPEGYVNNASDCNDANDQIHPGATEMCNGLDDNCDGQVDETTLNLNLSAGNILCNGGSTTITASGTGGAPPYLYSFNGGSFGTSNNFSATAGSHSVTIKDANNCQLVGTIDIDEPDVIAIDPIEITHVACSGGNTGAINITVSGGTGTYTYRWSNNRTTQDLVNVSGNTYSVTVTDANACTASASATVNPRLALTLTKTNVICNGGSDGTATATASGGTPDYSYEWSNGETTETITGLSAGTYTCTIMDALGCTRSKSIHVGQPSAIGISGIVTKVACHGAATGSIAITINNGVAPFTYNWSDGASTEDRSGLEAGSYTLLVTDVNGCTREKTFNVTQPAALTLNLSVDNVSCHGAADGAILASVTGGVKFPNSNLCKGERYCFEWSHGDTARITSGLETGIYTVSVTDANGCSIVGSATVTEPGLLEITEVLVESLPNGKYKLTVTAEGGTPTYKYRRIPGGSYQNSNVFNNVPSGTYEIVVRDLNLCTDTTTVDVGNAGRPGNPDERQDTGDVLILDATNPVLAYPNPASDRFHLLVEKEYIQANVVIFNAQGQLMEERNFEANADLGSYEVNTWKSGLYLIVIHLDGERFVQKVMVAGR